MLKNKCIVYSLKSEDSRIPIKIGSAQQLTCEKHQVFRLMFRANGMLQLVTQPSKGRLWQHSDQAGNFQPVTGSAEGSALHFSRLQ